MGAQVYFSTHRLTINRYVGRWVDWQSANCRPTHRSKDDRLLADCQMMDGCPSVDSRSTCWLTGCWEIVGRQSTDSRSTKALVDRWPMGAKVHLNRHCSENLQYHAVWQYKYQQKWTAVLAVYIPYWPSARAVLGEYRPEVLAVWTKVLYGPHGPYKINRGPIFSQYSTEQPQAIRALLHSF